MKTDILKRGGYLEMKITKDDKKRVYPAEEREEYINNTIDDLINNLDDPNEMTDELFKILYDKTIPIEYNSLFNADVLSQEEITKISKDKEKFIDEYIEYLRELNDRDLSNIKANEYKKIYKDFYSNYLKKYFYVIIVNIRDLADTKDRQMEIKLNTDRLVKKQANEIREYTIKQFVNANLDTTKPLFDYYLDIDIIKQAQEHLKNIIKTKNLTNIKRAESLLFNDLYTCLTTMQTKVMAQKIDKIYESNKTTYDAIHLKIKQIETLTQSIRQKLDTASKNLKLAKNSIARKIDNTIALGYTMIESKLQKELPYLLDNQENIVDLKLDYQATYKGKGHKKRPIATPVIVKLGVNMELESKKITPFDRFVLDRAFSIWQVNKSHLSPELIYKDFINKNVDISQMGSDIYKEIDNSLSKLMTSTMTIIIQDRETIKRLGLTDDDIVALGKTNYILPLSKTFIKLKNGDIKSDYNYIDENPQYFLMSERIGQIKTADRILIPTSTGFNMTKERMLIIDFLARHIEYLKSTKNNTKYNDELNYDTIIIKCELLAGIDEGTPKYRQYKKRYKDDIKTILQQYKMDKTIKDFKEYPSDKSIKKGISIIV